jgi:protein-S-isoprenylcysteine O-methyltransferase Ste14
MIQEYFAVGSFAFFVILVVIRTLLLKKQGITTVEFGKKDKTDFLILPFVLFYIYLILANTFNLPTIPYQILFHIQLISWIGAGTCFMGIVLLVWALVSFKKSFRIGLAENSAEGLITSGVFAISRNPIYVAFAIMLISQFLIFPSWILLLYIFLGILLFRRQILKEEAFLKEQYGDEFIKYSEQVKRWVGRTQKKTEFK